MEESTIKHPRGETLRYLQSLPLFEKFDRQALADLAKRVMYVQIRSDETLFCQDEIADAMYILVTGVLEALVAPETGKKYVVGEMYPRTTVGEIALLIGGKRNATVKAKKDCELIMLSRDNFELIVSKYPEIRKQLLDVVLFRLRKTQWMKILANYFGDIDEETHNFLESRFSWVHVKRNQALFEKGDDGDSLYILINGLLHAVNTDENGKHMIIGRVTQGEIVGEMAIITGEKRAASIYAVRECDLVRLSKESFEEISRRYPQIMVKITKILINRLRNIYNPSSQGYSSVTMAVIPAHDGRGIDESVEKLAAAFSKIGPTRVINAAVLSEQFRMKDIAKIPEKDPRAIGLAAWLEEQERTHSFVIYQAGREHSNWTKRCLAHADQILFFADFTDSRTSLRVTTDYIGSRTKKQITGAKTMLVFLHDENTAFPSGTGEWLKKINVSEFHHVRRERQADFERLARIISNRAIGLVLGGGGAKGIAHIGVIRALEEAGIPVDMVGGASIGSIIGGMFAMGKTPAEMLMLCEKMFVRINPFNEYTLPIISILRGKKVRKMVRISFGDTHIEDLWINYFCVSCNLTRSILKVHRDGPVWLAARASSSLPGVVVPVIFNNEVHVDGGVINNLPCDIMRERCGTVIAVNLSSKLALEKTINEFPSPWKVLLHWMLPFKKPMVVPNILDIMMSTIITGSTMHSNHMKETSDVYLAPPVGHVKLLGFKNLEKIYNIGYRYTKEALRNIEDPVLAERIMGVHGTGKKQ